jgi:hypothetical protein
MAIVALDAPDFRTIAEFCRRHLAVLSALFLQVLKLCERAGLVKLGHVALDGTKIKANASKHKAMSYERMSQREAELRAEVDGWLKAAEAADTAEDKAFGADKHTRRAERGGFRQIPGNMRSRRRRRRLRRRQTPSASRKSDQARYRLEAKIRAPLPLQS